MGYHFEDSSCRGVNTPEDVVKYINDNDIELVDLCFSDPLGRWHHTTFAPSECEATDLVRGYAFDGSSIQLFSSIELSDMLMIPDCSTCWVDPFSDHKTLHLTCSITDPYYNEFPRCPRVIANKAERYMQDTGICDSAVFGSEAEFFVFDDVRFNVTGNCVSFEVDGIEGPWRNGRKTHEMVGKVGLEKPTGNLGHRMPSKQAYFPVSPNDIQNNLRSQMLLTMKSVGIPIEKHHHEVASCQHELGFKFNTLGKAADQMMTYKYVVKNVASQNGLSATFMPKPILGDNGSGMHCHQSLWKAGINLFFDENVKYMKLSQTALWYIGGLLKHAPAILAFSNPTSNSYKRLVPGYEAPVNLVYSKGNRSAAIRIPMSDMDNPKAKRLEFRCPDPSCSPYITYTAQLMAGLDGILNKIDPGNPTDVDIYSMPKKQRELIQCTPASLSDALDALEKDHDFLLKGGVFDESFLKTYIEFKRAEIQTISMVPHPKEFELYYSC